MQLKHLRGFSLNESLQTANTGFILRITGTSDYEPVSALYIGKGMNYFEFVDQVKDTLNFDFNNGIPADEIDVDAIDPEDMFAGDYYNSSFEVQTKFWVADARDSKNEFESLALTQDSPYDVVECLDRYFTNAKTLMKTGSNAKDGNYLVSWVLEDPTERIETLDGFKDFKGLLNLLAPIAKTSGDADFKALVKYYRGIKGLL